MVSSRASRLVALVLAAALAACGGDDGPDYVPGEPASITLDTTAWTFTALGETRQFSATVLDGGGDPATGTVAWSTTDPSILRVDQSGLATAMGTGQATMMVTAGTVSTTMAITVTPAATIIIPALGNYQSADPSTTLHTPFGVRVGDASGFAVEGVVVQFATTSPGASLSVSVDTTDAQGYAEATMTLGPALGDYTATATVSGTAYSVTFNALARPAPVFDIEVVFTAGSPTASQAQAFRLAEERWERIITGDLPDDYAVLPEWSCGASPALDRPIDDLVIYVNLSEIDGPNGILGGAGVCFLHEVGLLPAIGQMTLDGADVAAMESQGLFETVVLHEMGHALGFGTLWTARGLLAQPSLEGGLDPHFTGAEALATFDAIGGFSYAGAKVPVENQGGPGTADGHWRETVFTTEMMTGYVNAGPNQLSRLSIAAMQDLGYVVDPAQGDPYSLLAALRSTIAPVAIELGNDLLPGPIKIINRKGKVVGTYRQ